MTGFSHKVITTTIIILALIGAAAYSISTTRNQTQTRSNPPQLIGRNGNLTIALGYWGPPSPFLFYPRGPGYVLTSLVFDTLLWKDNHSIIPWLAESWDHPDRYTWIFHLRHGVKWQDGEPLTARDIVFTFNYLEKNGWTWKNIDPSLINTVQAEDDYTVKIKLAKPYPFFLEDYATTIFILPEHIWSNISNPYTYKNQKAFIGSGPYTLVSYDPQKGYIFKANPSFWGGTPLFNIIKVTNIGFTNPQEEASALVNGEIDSAIFMGKSYPLIKMIKEKNPSIIITKGPMYWVLFLGFNLDKWPYNQTMFRQAIAYSLNLTELVEKAGGGLNASVTGSPGYIPPYSKFYNPNTMKYSYNPRKAGAILDQLGLKDIDGDGCRDLPSGSPFQPLLLTTKQYTQEALITKLMLQRVGICVSVKTFQSYGQLDNLVKKGLYDLEINGHGATGNTPTAFSWYFTGRFGVKWSNTTYTSTVMKIMSSQNETQAYYYSKIAQEIIASQLPEIALYYPNIFVATNPNAKVEWFFTLNGIDGGIPLPYNKLSLIQANVTGG